MSAPKPEQHAMHCDWIARMREEYDSMREDSLRESLDLGDVATPFSSSSSSSYSPTGAYVYADDEDVAPVYRSLGGMDPIYDAALDDADFDAPVYRSLGGLNLLEDSIPTPAEGMLDALGELRAQARGVGLQAVDGIWLSKMPPLLSRQQARGASVVVA